MSAKRTLLIIGLLSLLPSLAYTLDLDAEIARQQAKADRIALALANPESSKKMKANASEELPGFHVRLVRKSKAPIK